jgi:hypothetical protein
LGRFSGAGEDFCTREHRNQYRLRKGMDRLHEANKVASVIRRRESPRQIPPEQLRAGGEVAPRAFLEPRPIAETRTMFRVPEVNPISATRLGGSSGFVQPIANCVSEPIALPGPGAFPVASMAATPPVSAPALRTGIEPAPPAKAAPVAADVDTRRRAAVTGRRKLTPICVVKTPAPTSGAFSAPARKIAAPSMGRALRVSMASGFRVPEWKMRAAAVAHAPVAGLRWPDMREIDATASVAPPRLSSPGTLTIAPPEMRIPVAPPPEFAARIIWPGAMALAIQFVNAADGQRTAFVPFGYSDDSAKERR